MNKRRRGGGKKSAPSTCVLACRSGVRPPSKQGALMVILAVLFLGLILAAGAREPFPDESWRVRVELQVVRVPERGADEWAAKLGDEKTAIGALAELERQCLRGAARRMAVLLGEGTEGRPRFVQQGDEIRYPIEYERDDSRLGPPKGTRERNGKPVVTGYPATTFQTRSVGAVMETSARVFGDGRVITVFIQAGWTQLNGFERVESGRKMDGTKLHVELPKFIYRKTSAVTTMTSGVPMLLGQYPVQEEPGTVELHIVTATARWWGAAPAAATPETKGEADTLVAEPWQARLELLRFHVPPEEALALRPQLQNAARVDEATARLLALAREKRVKRLETITLPTMANRRAVFENVREVSYGVEMETSGPPSFFQNEAPPLPVVPFATEGSFFDPPSTFETRNTGYTFEAEPRISADGEWLDIQLAGQAVDLDGYSRWGCQVYRDGRAAFAYQPHFKSRRTSSNMVLANGKRVLLAFHRLPAPAKDFEITLLRAVTRRVPLVPILTPSPETPK